jgi:branched-chain amino acid aminotransferase
VNPDPFLPERFAPSLPDLVESVGLSDSFVYLDGHFAKGTAAAVSVWDHGLLYGDGVFEGIRAYNGKIFRLDEHLDRLYASAAACSLPVPLSPTEFATAIRLTFKVNNMVSGHARPMVTRGVGRSGLDPRRAIRPSVIIIVSSFVTGGLVPVSLSISGVRRRSSRSIDSSIKCLNYMDNVLARIEANGRGAYDAILLDLEGHVAEATAENVFLVKRGVVSTPTTSSALPGITRSLVMDYLIERGTEVHERDIEPAELLTADEVFLTGTAAEIVPVGSIDSTVIGDGGIGGITAEVAGWYARFTNSSAGNAI